MKMIGLPSIAVIYCKTPILSRTLIQATSRLLGFTKAVIVSEFFKVRELRYIFHFYVQL